MRFFSRFFLITTNTKNRKKTLRKPNIDEKRNFSIYVFKISHCRKHHLKNNCTMTTELLHGMDLKDAHEIATVD